MRDRSTAGQTSGYYLMQVLTQQHTTCLPKQRKSTFAATDPRVKCTELLSVDNTAFCSVSPLQTQGWTVSMKKTRGLLYVGCVCMCVCVCVVPPTAATNSFHYHCQPTHMHTHTHADVTSGKRCTFGVESFLKSLCQSLPQFVLKKHFQSSELSEK